MTAEITRFKGNAYCKFCQKDGVKTRVKWQSRYAPRLGTRDYKKHYACDMHAHLIEDTDPDRTRYATNKALNDVKHKENDHLSEADYQTWVNL